jgi:predicted ribosomally synthesized peptide with SipW-like signal peptide
MNKKILSLFILLIVLVSATVSYAYFNQSTHSEDHTDTGDDIDNDTLNEEIDATLLDEDEDIEIGDMI